MISSEQQADWAASLLENLGDTSMSNCYVVAWLRANLGFLNDHLSTDFQVSGSDSGVYITPEMLPIQSGIYNEMFICHWLRKKAINVLSSMEYDWIEMQGEDQGKIKRVSHKEKSAAYQSLAKDCEVRLKDTIKQYRGGDFAAPRQLLMNDRNSSPTDIYCRCVSNLSPTNPVYEYFS